MMTFLKNLTIFSEKIWFAHFVTTVIFDSAWDISRDSWANSQGELDPHPQA